MTLWEYLPAWRDAHLATPPPRRDPFQPASPNLPALPGCAAVSTILLGAQMPPVMNALGTDACVYGNHE